MFSVPAKSPRVRVFNCDLANRGLGKTCRVTEQFAASKPEFAINVSTRSSRESPATANRSTPSIPVAELGHLRIDSSARRPATGTIALLQRLLQLSWAYRWGCVELLLLQGLLLATNLLIAHCTGLGVDVVRFAVEPGLQPPVLPFGLTFPNVWEPMNQVTAIAVAVLILASSRALLNYRYAVQSARLIHERIVVDLRARVFSKLQWLGFRFFDKQPTGGLISRVTSDVQSVRAFVDGVLVQLVILLLSFVFYVGYMASIDLPLTLACLATTPAMIWLTIEFGLRTRPAYDRNRELSDELVLALTETVQGVQVVKGFGREPEEIARFAAASHAVRDQQHGIFRAVSTYSPVMTMLSQVNVLVLLSYGGWLVARNEMPLGTGLVVFAQLLQHFSHQIANVTAITNSIQQSLSGAQRVFEVLDMPEEIRNVATAVDPGRMRGEIEFDRVSFAHHADQTVLSNLSFRVPAGSQVAVMGSTGSGKSTLLQLIARLYDPVSGTVRIDGHDLRQLDLTSLRKQISIVFQESFLFSNTVSANIAFGAPFASQNEIQAAAETAAAADFIGELPEGYQTILGEGGNTLSGGQRQRLAIARAVLASPAILLLDDPSASLDSKTEEEIFSALQAASRGRTSFVVTHRLSMAMRSDLILFLEDGKLVQTGTHAELIAVPGPYRAAASVQSMLHVTPPANNSSAVKPPVSTQPAENAVQSTTASRSDAGQVSPRLGAA